MDLLRVISHHRARLATPIRTVQKIYGEADLENVPFADTIFTRPRAAANRPLMLIESSHKISSDDKVKASTRSAARNEEKDTKVEATAKTDFESDSKAGLLPLVDSKGDKVTLLATSTASTKSQSGILVADNIDNEDQPNENIGDARRKKMGVLNSEDINRVGAISEKSPATDPESASEKTDSSSIPPAKQDIERSVASQSIPRTPLEENIVLGVALDGSKRILPIEEEMTASPIPAESKELAASRNGNGNGFPPSGGKDKKDGQMPAVPGANQTD